MTIHPDPWRADHLHAAVYVPAEPFPTWHVVGLVLLLVGVLTYYGVVMIGGRTCPDCTPGKCDLCDLERRRERRGP